MEEKETIETNGFSFHLKVILLFIAFALYVGLELSLNLMLIDLYSQPAAQVFSEHAESVSRLDLFGRALSSFGIALALISFVPIQRLLPKLTKVNPTNSNAWQKIKSSKKFHQTIATYVTRPLLFFALWLILIPSLRLIVDSIVHSRSNDTKLSAVRAVIYKEGFLSGVIKVQDFEQLNAIAQDPQRRDLVVALIPSLAFSSKPFNQMIEQNMEQLANTFLSDYQTRRFVGQGIEKLRDFDQLYQSEFQLYQKSNAQYQQAVYALSSGKNIYQEQGLVIDEVNAWLHAHWNNYVREFDIARDKFRTLAKNESLRKAHHEYKSRYRSSKCNSNCKTQVDVAHADYFNSLTYQDGSGLGIKVLPEHIFYGAVGTEDRILGMLTRGRKHWLRMVYGVGEHEEFAEFAQSEEARKLLIKKFKEKGIALSSDWQMHDSQAIYQQLLEKYQQQAANIWRDYSKTSQFNITQPGLDRIDFATHATTQQQAQKALGEFYIDDFSPSMAESRYQQKWLEQQNNISFIRMITSTAATGAFAPGGILFDIGNDAVKLAVILPLSVILSFIAICLLFYKFYKYLRTSKTYLVFLFLVLGVVLVLPVWKSVTKENSYGQMMSAFAKDFHQNNSSETSSTFAFGLMLDIENGLYESYHDNPFIKNVSKIVFRQFIKNQDQQNQASSTFDDNFFSALNVYDDFFYQNFPWLINAVIPSFLPVGDIQQFDANITVLKRNQSIGAFMGINMQAEKVSKVTMPNFLANTDLGLLAEQRYFYQTDVKQLAQSFVENYEDGDFLMSIANGTAMRESTLQKVERLMVEVLNQQPSLVKVIHKLSQGKDKNLVLIQLNNSENYHCYLAPKLNSGNFAQAIAGSEFTLQAIKNCQGTL